VAGLAGLAGRAAGAVTLDAMEELVIEGGRGLLCGVVQLALDGQADAEVRLAGVTGVDGIRRGRAEPGHAVPVITRLGKVRVRRVGYRAGVRGVASLFPRDAVLNLAPLGYSWGLQRLAQMFCRSGSYEQAHELVLAATGVAIGKRQLEQIAAAAAAGVAAFYDGPAGGQLPAGPGAAAAGPEEGKPLPLGLSADGKGVAMRPESRRAGQGAGRAGQELRVPARHRGERPQAGRRGRVRVRRDPPAGAADPGAGDGRPPRR